MVAFCDQPTAALGVCSCQADGAAEAVPAPGYRCAPSGPVIATRLRLMDQALYVVSVGVSEHLTVRLCASGGISSSVVHHGSFPCSPRFTEPSGQNAQPGKN